MNSLKTARDGGFGGGADDPTDAYRYEKLKIFSRVTGKSMYKEYDVMLEADEELMLERIEGKLVEYLTRTKRWKAVELALTKQVKVADTRASKASSNLLGNLFSRPSHLSTTSA